MIASCTQASRPGFLVRPSAIAPSPDELDVSYAGALMRINGYRTERELLAAIAASQGRRELSLRATPMIELLARTSGMTLKDFVFRHTNLPFQRCISAYGASNYKGGEGRKIPGLRRGRPNSVGAMFCPGCVRAEQENFGRSYWHREQQVPGFIWCSKHQLPLLACKGDGAYLRSPSEFLSTGAYDPIECNEAFVKSPEYKTYVGVCAALMETSKPYFSRALGALLAEQCLEQKIDRFPAHRSWMDISSVARQTFPFDWLKSLIPSSVMPGRIEELEGVAWGSSHSHPIVFAVACALLYVSADEAMDYMFHGIRRLEFLHGKADCWTCYSFPVGSSKKRLGHYRRKTLSRN